MRQHVQRDRDPDSVGLVVVECRETQRRTRRHHLCLVGVALAGEAPLNGAHRYRYARDVTALAPHHEDGAIPVIELRLPARDMRARMYLLKSNNGRVCVVHDDVAQHGIEAHAVFMWLGCSARPIKPVRTTFDVIPIFGDAEAEIAPEIQTQHLAVECWYGRKI